MYAFYIYVNSVFLAISLIVAYRSKKRDVSTKLSRAEAVKYVTYICNYVLIISISYVFYCCE